MVTSGWPRHVLTVLVLVAGPWAWLLTGPAAAAATGHPPATSTSTSTSTSTGNLNWAGDRQHVAPRSGRGDLRICTTPAVSCQTGPVEPHGFESPRSAKVDLLPDIDLNPLDDLGSAIAKAAADAWTSAMMAVWASGLFVLRIVLTFSESFLTPDLGPEGPGSGVYAVTLWMAGALATILVLVQLGRAAFTREGKSLAHAAIGAGQFVLAYACWLGYCTIVVAACGTLSKALMVSLLDVQSWPEFDPLAGFSSEDVTDAGTATVLAFLGVFLWIAAIGHILVYLARAASLLVLAATGPIAAAGLVADATRSWFWKSLRWFHAAALTPVLMVLVLGIGVQFASGVAASMADGAQKAVATALPAVMLILVSTIAPMALFKLLAFVDPGTPSGASFRQGMAAAGGAQGLLTGKSPLSAGGGSGASTTDGIGRSSGEHSAEETTGERYAKAASGAAGLLTPVGRAAAAGVGVVTKAGGLAAALVADETNQAGAGHGTYGPDFSTLGGRGGHRSSPPSGHAAGGHGSSGGDSSGGDSSGGGSGDGYPPPSAPSGLSESSGYPGPAAPGGGPATGSPAGGGAAGAGEAARSSAAPAAGSVAGAATAIPPVA